MGAKSLQAERTAWGVLGVFHVLGNTSLRTQQDTALHCIWWVVGQCVPALSLAPPAPLDNVCCPVMVCVQLLRGEFG